MLSPCWLNLRVLLYRYVVLHSSSLIERCHVLLKLLSALFQGRCQRRPAAHEEGCARCDSLRLERLVEIDLDLGNVVVGSGTDEACIAGAALMILVLLLLAECSDAFPRVG